MINFGVFISFPELVPKNRDLLPLAHVNMTCLAVSGSEGNEEIC